MEGHDGVNAPMATTETFKREKHKKWASQVMLKIDYKKDYQKDINSSH